MSATKKIDLHKKESPKEIDYSNSENGELSKIIIKGARQHNLKGMNVDIPRDKLVVVTGLSGSGKSSLAFDTIYAEGQRRYVECLSAYARQFLGVLKKPEVDSIEGLSPAISIEQKSISHNPRSTVGTVTEIYDYLRLLYAKIGIQHCVECQIPVVKKTSEQIVEDIYKNFNGQKIMILAPLIRGRKGHYRELFEQLLKQGFTKARVDGNIIEITDELELSRYKVHDIELVVDRCLVNLEQEQRISESLNLTLNRADGIAIVLSAKAQTEEWKETFFSTDYSCPSCNKSYQPLAPNMFSFNSPYGACNECGGLGKIESFSIDLLIPDRELSIADGAIALLGKKRSMWIWSQVEAFAQLHNIEIDTPIKNIPESFVNELLYGAGETEIPIKYNFASGLNIEYRHKYIGIIPMYNNHYLNTSSAAIRKNISEFMVAVECKNCNGGRLKPENLAVLINSKSIKDIVLFDVQSAFKYFSQLHKMLSERELIIANLILKEINSRLKFLTDVGLSYLTLDRTIATLSGGESQRIRLASQIGSELVGITYVLDEPSIGLHQHDNNRLIKSLKHLRDLGNTVLVVEHDKAMIEQSDFIIDIGPKAGVHGGELLFNTAPNKLGKINKKILDQSLTAQYLLGKKRIEVPETRRQPNGKFLILEGAKGNNLKNVNLKLPLGTMICITGLSGSGKSTLLNDTLYPILANKFYRAKQVPLQYNQINGLELIDKVIEINQSPIGRTPRSNPATYTGVFTQIRDFFSMLPESKIRGYKPGRFSFNVRDGRCETCEGGGIKKIEMNFLPEVYVVCDDCEGRRYNRETLTVKYKNKSIADVLEMTIDEALEFFNEIPKIKNKLKTLCDVGLGYIKLGQQAPTLSGGEAQRVKLSTELSKTSTGKTLYLMDEPTTGLHFEDIRILLKLLNELVDKGNTVVVIEHNLDVIKCADWIIDLGPGAGVSGGEIVAEGTPETIINNPNSITGHYLKEEIK